MTHNMPLLARSIHVYSTGSVKDQMFYLICLKFVLRLDQKIYKLNPNPEFLASIRSLEALIDRFDINPKPSHELNTGKGLTGNPVIVASDRTGYNAKPNPMEEMIPV